MWYCAAYKKSLTIYPDGIAPCCSIKSYKKPLSLIGNKHAFDDLITGSPPDECSECVLAESRNLPSYRQYFNARSDKTDNLKFVDIRNSNHCNLKCRTCGPHASSQWEKEQAKTIKINYNGSLEKYYETIITPYTNDFYFTGGEPLLTHDHWKLLEKLIELGYSKNVTLRYNTNLTVLKYKEKDIYHLWDQFKNINILCSIDAIGQRFDYIRSGAKWENVNNNLLKLIEYRNQKNKNLNVSISYTVSILNIWDMYKDLEYFKDLNVPVKIGILNNPDILSLTSIHDDVKEQALDSLNRSRELLPLDIFDALNNIIINNHNRHLFKSTLSYILYVDKIRNENLFDYLPFKELAYELLIRNP